MGCTMRKIVETKKFLSNTIQDTIAQSCVTPLPELCTEGLRMIVLVSLIVLLRGFHDFFSHCASHPN